MSETTQKPEHDWVAVNRAVLELADGSHAEVARILGYTDRRNVWPWTRPTDAGPFPPHHCHALERHFGAHKITRQQLRPHDWQKHWPDLADTTPVVSPALSPLAPVSPLA